MHLESHFSEGSRHIGGSFFSQNKRLGLTWQIAHPLMTIIHLPASQLRQPLHVEIYFALPSFVAPQLQQQNLFYDESFYGNWSTDKLDPQSGLSLSPFHKNIAV